MTEPQIIQRVQWGAAEPLPGTPRSHDDVTLCFLHYSDTHESIPAPGTVEDEVVVRAIQAYHMSKGYVDIAYEGLVGANGTVFVGRSGDIDDASTCNNNRNGYGICVLSDGPITPAQESSVRWLVDIGRLVYPNMNPHPLPHSFACATACPGDTIRTWMMNTQWR